MTALNAKKVVLIAHAVVVSGLCASQSGVAVSIPVRQKVVETRGSTSRPWKDLSLRTTFFDSKEPLTTEKAWTVDPEERNPHRQRWLLSRHVELHQLQMREIEKTSKQSSVRYGVTIDSIQAATQAYYRPEGPWYRPLSEFPCTPEPLSWFATAEGARKGAAHAAQSWEKLLSDEKIKLSVQLSRVVGDTPGTALKKADTLFRLWLGNLDDRWRRDMRPKAKAEEWALYLERASEAGVCAKSKLKIKTSSSNESIPSDRPKSQKVPWEEMMEPPSTDPQTLGGPSTVMRLLARAPSHRWDGLFSIHANVMVAGRKLNGKFLIDSGAGMSVLSPDFLQGQGILPGWIEIPGLPAKRVPWGGGIPGVGGLAPQAYVDRVDIGNTPLKLTDFLIFDSEFFSPPDSAKSCCDGVLGTDLLRKYVVEFQPGPPSEVKIWPAEGFHLADGSPWIEVALTPEGEAVSACQIVPVGSKLGSSQAFVGVAWDTGRESGLDIHIPWQNQARAAMKGVNAWDIHCGASGGEPIARDIPAGLPRADSGDVAAIYAKAPASTVGMAVLGRTRVFFDLPHGRIWFPEKISSYPLLENRSGLKLKYRFLKFDHRGLFVESIASQGPVRELVKAGLKVGMQITRIDDTDPSGLDSWEVEQRLAGALGSSVMLQWKNAKGLKLAELQVRPKPLPPSGSQKP